MRNEGRSNWQIFSALLTEGFSAHEIREKTTYFGDFIVAEQCTLSFLDEYQYRGLYSPDEEIWKKSEGLLFLDYWGIYFRAKKSSDRISKTPQETFFPYPEISEHFIERKYFGKPRLHWKTHQSWGIWGLGHFYVEFKNEDELMKTDYRIKEGMSFNRCLASFREDIYGRCKTEGKLSLEEGIRIFRKYISQNIVPDGYVAEWVEYYIANLIKEGLLDGIYTKERQQYLSALLIGRERIEYQVAIDFNLLAKQLSEKGIVLTTLECPNCGGRISYPKAGNVITCEYCKTSIQAIDIFEKFKGFLGV